jgi:membrane associated rhomboid family serine protease
MLPLRDENPTHSTPVLTILLIVANVLVYFYQTSLDPAALQQFVMEYGVVPAVVGHGENLVSLVTSMFLHGGLLHLVGNMWFLWIFGDNVEDKLGKPGFVFFYFATGVAAALAHVAVNPGSEVPVVGASGAISGVLGAYLVLHPRIRVKTLVTLGFFWNVLYIPAGWFLAVWFGLQLLGGFQPGAGGGVAYGAHVGGFVAGIALIFLMTRRDARPRARYEAGRAARWR